MKLSHAVMLFIPFALGSGACSKKEASKDNPLSPVVKAPEGVIDIDLTDRNERLRVAFAGFIQSCEQAGGRFDKRTRNCVCPGISGIPASFQAITRLVTADGVKSKVFDHFECREQLSLKTSPSSGYGSFRSMLQEDRNAFIEDLQSARTLGNGRVLYFEVPIDASDPSLWELATFLDSHELRIGVPNGSERGDAFRVKLLDSRNFISSTKRLPFFDFEDVAMIERPGNTLFAWTPEDLLKLLDTSAADSLSLVTPEGPHADFLEGLQFYQSYLRGETKGEVEEDVVIIDQGCDVVCDYSASFHFKGRFYWYEKNYARAQHFRHALYMGHEDGRIDAMALLFNDYSPSVIITEKATVGSAGEVNVKNEAFDARFNPVDSEDEEVISPGDGFYEKLARLDRLDVQNPQTSVIYLEGRTRLEESWEEDVWLRGPYAVKLPAAAGSGMGWVKGDPTDFSLVSWFNGVFDADYFTSAKHVREVLHDIVKDFKRGDVYAVPADLMTAGTQLKELSKLAKSRIVMISSVYPVGEAECNRLLGADDGGLLWIISAGNEGVENPRFRCPQRLRRDGLKIVVASGDRSTLADHAEYGVDYADIAADPTSYLGRHGSSYAAPKVANLALKIVKKFGHKLSNREIRLAILLGADVKINARLKVRTGGAFSEAFAMKAAEAIQGLTDEQRQRLIEAQGDRRPLFSDIISKSGALSGSEAKSQADYLQNAKL